MMRALAVTLLVAMATCVSGCNVLAYFGYLVAPEGPRKTVEAAYKGLENQNVAVVVYTDSETEFNYPWLAARSPSRWPSN